MEHYITVPKTARYFSKGNPTAKKLLVVLHGYGQLARYFIHKFNDLSDDWYVVAPEGLHRFYQNGHSGRVGASWMTKEDREMDIQDNLEWLHQLSKQLFAENNYEETVLLGFSQGAATAARYFYGGQSYYNRFIVWASVLPPDLDAEELFAKHQEATNNTFVVGTNDEFFSTEQQAEYCIFYKNLGFNVNQFEGKHDIDIPTLKEILHD